MLDTHCICLESVSKVHRCAGAEHRRSFSLALGLALSYFFYIGVGMCGSSGHVPPSGKDPYGRPGLEPERGLQRTGRKPLPRRTSEAVSENRAP